MENSKSNFTRSWFSYGLAGFLLGILLVSLSAASFIAVQIANPPPTSTPLPTPTFALQALLDQAYQALYVDNDPQAVLDLLESHLNEFTNPEDLAIALEYLARAELLLGQYQFAATYFEKLVQISPTSENYAQLAAVYDAGGDLEHALTYYLILLELNDPPITDEERELVQGRVTVIQGILTGFTPTPSP